MTIANDEKHCATEITRRSYHKGLITGYVIGTVGSLPALVNFGAPTASAIGFVIAQSAIIGGAGYAFSRVLRRHAERRLGTSQSPDL